MPVHSAVMQSVCISDLQFVVGKWECSWGTARTFTVLLDFVGTGEGRNCFYSTISVGFPTQPRNSCKHNSCSNYNLPGLGTGVAVLLVICPVK